MKEKNRTLHFYYYWYFTIFSIYEKRSKGKYFDIFATGLFSLFPSCLVIGLYGIVFFLLGETKSSMLSPEGSAIIGMVILAINLMVFLPKSRQQKLYTKYKECRSPRNNICASLLTVVSVALFVLSIRCIQ